MLCDLLERLCPSVALAMKFLSCIPKPELVNFRTVGKVTVTTQPLMFNFGFSLCKWRLMYIGLFQVNVPFAVSFSVIVVYTLVLIIHFCAGLNLKRLWVCLVRCCGVLLHFHIAAGW